MMSITGERCFEIVVFVGCILLTACSSRDLYNAIQPNSSANSARLCSEKPRSQQAECNTRGMSYEEYERARRETLD